MSESTDKLLLSESEKRLLDKTPDANRELRIQELQQELSNLPPPTNSESDTKTNLHRAQLWLEVAGHLLDLDRKNEAWDFARPSIEYLIAGEAFEDAALACQYVYLCDQFDAIPAIGQAAWLSVTYPVDPHLTANILNHIIDETPDDSDGAAVAAATAHYVVDIRSEDAQRTELRMFTGANLARVAKRHSQIDSQRTFELWVERLELDVPDKFLVRLRNVIDVLVQFDWWFDRDELVERIPE